MAMTATERSRVLRERRARGNVVLTVVVGEDELAEIAQAATPRRPRRIARLSGRQLVPERRSLGAHARPRGRGVRREWLIIHRPKARPPSPVSVAP